MTTKALIKTHNELARRLDQAELTTWKAGKEKLQARIDAMRELVAVDAEEADPLAIPEAAEAFGDAEPDQVPAEASEEPDGTDQAPVEASEPVVESAEARGGIGQMIADLLVDAEGYEYGEIVDIVRGGVPEGVHVEAVDRERGGCPAAEGRRGPPTAYTGIEKAAPGEDRRGLSAW
jgi:hypothetical protein